MADYGFTNAGFVRPTMSDIRQDIIDTIEDKLKLKIKTSPDSVFGQLVDCLAERDATKWETLEAGINNINPLEADDIMLDKAVSFVGVTRIPASYGTCTVTLGYNSTSSYTLPAYNFVVQTSDNSSKWHNPSEVKLGKLKASRAKITPKDSAIKEGSKAGTITLNKIAYKFSFTTTPANMTRTALCDDFVNTNKDKLSDAGITVTSNSGSIEVDFHTSNTGSCVVTDTMFSVVLYTKFDVECQTTGALEAAKGVMTQMVSSLQEGMFVSVTNEEDAIPGHARESAADLRIRYEQGAQYINGGCTKRAIEERIKQFCSNIEAVKVFDNKTDVADALGRPPHSTHVVVKGGNATQIGTLVYNMLPGGMPTFGNTVVDIDRNNSIKIDRPTPVYIHMRIHVEGDPTNDEEMTKGVVVSIPSTLAQYGENTHTIGTNVVAGRILSNVYNLTGVVSATLKLAKRLDDKTPEDTEFAQVDYIDIADNQYCVFKAENIIVQ